MAVTMEITNISTEIGQFRTTIYAEVQIVTSNIWLSSQFFRIEKNFLWIQAPS